MRRVCVGTGNDRSPGAVARQSTRRVNAVVVALLADLQSTTADAVNSRCQGLVANKELINNHHQQQGAVAPDAALPANQLPEDQSWNFSNLRYHFDPVILSYSPLNL